MSVNVLLNDTHYVSGTNKMIYNFPAPMKLTNKEVSLTSLSFYNCFNNISAKNENNVFSFSFPVSYADNDAPVFQTFTYTFTDGFYSIEDIDKALQLFFALNYLYLYDTVTGKNVYFVSILANNPLYAFQINTYNIPSSVQATELSWEVPDGSPLALNSLAGATCKIYGPKVTVSENLGYLLGLSAGTYPPTTVSQSTTGAGTDYAPAPAPAYYIVSPFAPQINYVKCVLITTNLVQNFGYSVPTNLLQMVPVDSEFGAISQYVNNNSATYSSIMNNNQFSYIELAFWDQNMQPINFRDRSITANLSIKDA